MEELRTTRQKVVELLGKVKELEEGVVCAERHYDGKCYAMAYVDLADDVVGRAKDLQDFQERILGDDFFGTSGDLRWNKYLYIVAGPKSLSHDGFQNAKASIESDKEYARKHVVSEDELEALLSAAQHFTPNTSRKDFNVVGEWETRLAATNLDELLDRPTRKDVVERIGTRSAKRVPVTDKNLTLNAADTHLAQKWLASISIDKFRPVHDRKAYTFGQVTLIVGPNGTGKTSLLEAIEYFYCSHNRRQGGSSTPKISGTLVGSVAPLSAPAEPARIRARCFSWYNRDERLAKSILGAFTRYNFLDTDAAFRLSTELEPSEIPEDLSRLLVGADASTIWGYLTKIAPEVETARDRAIIRVNESQQKLEMAQKELADLQGHPSNGKALTEAFRTVLNTLGWKAPRATTPLVTLEEANGLQEVLGHIQAVLAAGSAAISLDAIAARSRELKLALARARPLDSDRVQYRQELRRLQEEAQGSERALKILDRWLTYVNSGFSATHARITEAKREANVALSRLGIYSNGNMPEVPEEYASVPLKSALESASFAVRTAAARVTDLESQSNTFGKVASERAQAARQLRAAAQASLDAGHPKDNCPICHAKYSPENLAELIDQITGALEQPSELVEVATQLAETRSSLRYLQAQVNCLQSLHAVVGTINLPSDTVCGAIPTKLLDLRDDLAKANSELAAAHRDWERLATSGLSINENEALKNEISSILNNSNLALNATVIEEVRLKLSEAAAAARNKESENLELLKNVSEQLAEISEMAAVEGWSTLASRSGGMAALVMMQDEIAFMQSRACILQDYIEIDGTTLFAELSSGVVGAIRVHSEALEAVQIENTMSSGISTLTQRIKDLGEQLEKASAQADNYKAAYDTLERLLTECSLEQATQESLHSIGSHINEIFGRIHSPNEYEYVGKDGVLLQTSATHEERTLEQVSTGQRAAFALSVFLAMNRSATSAPPVILIDDPIAHIDDLNALSFLDYLRDLTVNSNRQIFFATADTRIASLFTRKFGFLGESFKTIQLA